MKRRARLMPNFAASFVHHVTKKRLRAKDYGYKAFPIWKTRKKMDELEQEAKEKKTDPTQLDLFSTEDKEKS